MLKETFGAGFFDYEQAENPSLHVVHVQPGVIETTLNKNSGIPGMDERKRAKIPFLPRIIWLIFYSRLASFLCSLAYEPRGQVLKG